MNIFYLDKNPIKAAQIQYNKHVVKMILESAQMLCTAHHHWADEIGYKSDYIPYKKTHYNHPSIGIHGNEYTKRYSKTHLTITKCKEPLDLCPFGMPDGDFTEPPQAMPDEYKVEGDSLSAYWNYYEGEKYKIAAKNEMIIKRNKLKE